MIRAQLSSEAVVRAKFAEMDVNGSGTLAPTELATLTQALGSALSTHQLTRFMEDLDADCDGAVSLEDYVAWVTQVQYHVMPTRIVADTNACRPREHGQHGCWPHTRRWHCGDAAAGDLAKRGHQVLRLLSVASAVLLMLCGAVLIIACSHPGPCSLR